MNGLFAGAHSLPGLWGIDPTRLPNGTMPHPAAPPINVQPLAGPGVERVLPNRMDAIRGVLGRAGRGAGQVFGGADDPRLTPEQNAAARNQALIRAGLTMMAASGGGAGFGQSLATGALAGMDAGMQGREDRAEADRRARSQRTMQEVIAGGVDVPTMRRMLQEALASGDIESAKVLAQVIPSMESAARPPAPAAASTIRASGRDFPNTPEGAAAALEWTKQYAAATRIPGAGTGGGGGRAPYDPETDPVLQRMIAARDLGLTSSPTTGDERMAAGALNMADDAAPVLDNIERDISAALVNRIPGIGNLVTTEAEQVAEQAGRQLLGAYNLVVSGKGVTEQEYQRNRATFVPMPGDKPATLTRKRQARARMLETIRTASGRAAPPRAAETSAGGGFEDLVPTSVGAGGRF